MWAISNLITRIKRWLHTLSASGPSRGLVGHSEVACARNLEGPDTARAHRGETLPLHEPRAIPTWPRHPLHQRQREKAAGFLHKNCALCCTAIIPVLDVSSTPSPCIFTRLQVRSIPVDVPTAENLREASNCRKRKGTPRNNSTPRQGQNSPESPRQQLLAIMQSHGLNYNTA